MIDRVIDFSARNRGLVIAIAVAAAIGGWWSMRAVPLDALPDLGDTQVIVYSQWDRSPDIVEDQVTYPIVTAMLGAPKVRAVRGFSDFGYSFGGIVTSFLLELIIYPPLYEIWKWNGELKRKITSV